MKVCVSCHADVEGKRAVPVRWDRLLKGILAIKRALRIAQNNELFVCEQCMQKHLERRRSFEKSMLFASVFAGLLLIVIIMAPLMSGTFEPFAVVSGFIVAGFILALPLFKYAPAVEGISASAPQQAFTPQPQPAGAEKAAKPKKPKKKK
ncbi:MAG: hypothetical protein AB1324_07365 [Candidatus Micrarchaeota archaeon]